MGACRQDSGRIWQNLAESGGILAGFGRALCFRLYMNPGAKDLNPGVEDLSPGVKDPLTGALVHITGALVHRRFGSDHRSYGSRLQTHWFRKYKETWG